MQMDFIPESLGACRLAEDPTTAYDGARGENQWAMMVGTPMEMVGAAAGATQPSEAEAGTTEAVPESEAQMPAMSGQQAAHPKMPHCAVGHSVRPLIPQVAPPAAEVEDEVKEIGREEPRP